MNTSPLLKTKTLQKAVNVYGKLNFLKFDGLNTFEIVKEFLWDKKKPINYKLSKQPMSQNLNGVFKHVPAIAIMSKSKIIKYKNVLGKKPYKMFLTKPSKLRNRKKLLRKLVESLITSKIKYQNKKQI